MIEQPIIFLNREDVDEAIALGVIPEIGMRRYADAVDVYKRTDKLSHQPEWHYILPALVWENELGMTHQNMVDDETGTFFWDEECERLNEAIDWFHYKRIYL